jgi:release factor glutamine methyltransferase
VLIPRPDTETLVEAVVSAGPFHRILDLGTGSGCIAISLAKRFPGSAVFASDVSAPALAVCRENSRAILGYELSTIESDLFDRVEGRFDCIVSNPPYLTVSEWNERRAQGWVEPEGALVAGIDGLDVIRKIITDAVELLEPGGSLYVEAAPHQFDEIRTLYAGAGFREITVYRDLAGNDRAASGRVAEYTRM